MENSQSLPVLFDFGCIFNGISLDMSLPLAFIQAPHQHWQTSLDTPVSVISHQNEREQKEEQTKFCVSIRSLVQSPPESSQLLLQQGCWFESFVFSFLFPLMGSTELWLLIFSPQSESSSKLLWALDSANNAMGPGHERDNSTCKADLLLPDLA